ncbi:MAG: DUF1501 domain-containing protein [Chloroflexota bacterium]
MTTLSRRDVLKSATPALTAWMLAPVRPARLLPRFAVLSPQGQAPRANVLVCVFLRGGMDGLNTVIPHGDPNYYDLRPSLGIPEPTNGDDSAIDLDGFFSLHPSLRPLKDVWDDDCLAVVHATGSPDPSHSHFDAMDYMERGTPGEKQIPTGWLARHLELAAWQNGSPFRAVGFGTLLPSSLRGPIPSIALKSIADFHLGGRRQSPELEQFQAALMEMYANGSSLDDNAAFTMDAISMLESAASGEYVPSNNAVYPESEFGESLKQTAQLIKAEIGLEVAAVDLGGWDTHNAQGQLDGQMPALLADLGASLSAFYQDMGESMKNITVVTMSEFGRRAAENASAGTDHGHGNLMLLMGKSLNGGRVYGQWPGLAPEQLASPGDLAITTDFRSVLGELLQKHLLDPQVEQVFPNFSNYQPLGFAKEL